MAEYFIPAQCLATDANKGGAVSGFDLSRSVRRNNLVYTYRGFVIFTRTFTIPSGLPLAPPFSYLSQTDAALFNAVFCVSSAWICHIYPNLNHPFPTFICSSIFVLRCAFSAVSGSHRIPPDRGQRMQQIGLLGLGLVGALHFCSQNLQICPYRARIVIRASNIAKAAHSGYARLSARRALRETASALRPTRSDMHDCLHVVLSGTPNFGGPRGTLIALQTQFSQLICQKFRENHMPEMLLTSSATSTHNSAYLYAKSLEKTICQKFKENRIPLNSLSSNSTLFSNVCIAYSSPISYSISLNE